MGFEGDTATRSRTLVVERVPVPGAKAAGNLWHLATWA